MIKRVLKIAGLILVIVLIGIQFVPVERTNPAVDLNQDRSEVRWVGKGVCGYALSAELRKPRYIGTVEKLYHA